MNRKISVIIPCYNQGTYLLRAIDSLQRQSLQEWEALIIDDGSTDNSVDIANTLAAKDNRIRIFCQANKGSGSARNTGLANAQGEYIQFLDADDTIGDTKFEKQLQIMLQQNAEISYTDFTFFDAEGNIDETHSVRINYRKILTRWGLGVSIPIHSFLYKRELIGTTRFDMNIRQREDWYWALAMFSKAKHIVHVPICGAFYFKNANGKTGNVARIQKGNFLFMDQMYPHMKGLNRIGWLYRISEEYWIYILRRIKTRDTALRKTLPPSSPQKFLAIAMMPISLISVIDYAIRTYLV